MAKTRKVWTYRPPRPPAPTVPAPVKADVQAQAQHLIVTVLGPRYIKPPPENPRFNYLVAISSKWWRHYFYFTATYAVPGPNALVPSFADPFARLEYAGGDRFHLAFHRHMGEWITVYRDLSLADCLAAITTDPWFMP